MAETPFNWRGPSKNGEALYRLLTAGRGDFGRISGCRADFRDLMNAIDCGRGAKSNNGLLGRDSPPRPRADATRFFPRGPRRWAREGRCEERRAMIIVVQERRLRPCNRNGPVPRG